MKDTPRRILRRRRVFVALAVFTALIVVGLKPDFAVDSSATVAPVQTNVLSEQSESQELARDVLDRILVRGRAPKTGYARDEFGDGWGVVGGCDMRNIMLARGMQDVVLAEDGCVVLSGTLNDPYTSTVIEFVRGNKTSNAVQIDHVVALSDAWQRAHKV